MSIVRKSLLALLAVAVYFIVGWYSPVSAMVIPEGSPPLAPPGCEVAVSDGAGVRFLPCEGALGEFLDRRPPAVVLVVPDPPAVTEDDPGWDCHSQGNGLCGEDQLAVGEEVGAVGGADVLAFTGPGRAVSLFIGGWVLVLVGGAMWAGGRRRSSSFARISTLKGR